MNNAKNDSIHPQKILNRRIKDLSQKKPNWVLRHIWVIPLLSTSLIFVSQGKSIYLVFVIITVTVYVAYSFFTFHAWKNWPHNSRIKPQQTLIIILFYNGFSLLSISLISFLLANMLLRGLEVINPKLIWTISSLVIVLSIIYIWVYRFEIINHMLENKSALSEKQKKALVIQNFLIGIGVSLGAVLRGSSLSIIRLLLILSRSL